MTILVAVDGKSVPDPVVEVGADLADAYDAELVVLHVSPEETFEATRKQVDGEYYLDDAVEDARTVAHEVATGTLGTFDGATRGQVGNPARQILAVASDLDPTYLVIGGRKRTPVGKALFGSVTQSVLLEATRPVVTVTEQSDRS